MWLYFDCYASFLPRIIEWWNGLSGNWAEAEEESTLGWAAQGAGLGLGVIIIIQLLKKKKIDGSIDYLFIIIWVCDVGRRRGFKKEEEKKKQVLSLSFFQTSKNIAKAENKANIAHCLFLPFFDPSTQFSNFKVETANLSTYLHFLWSNPIINYFIHRI